MRIKKSQLLRVTATAAFLSTAFAAGAHAIQLGVPSYFDPGTSAYSTLISEGTKVGIDMINIGNGEIDPNDTVANSGGSGYDNESLAPWVTESQELHAAGAKVFFYVHSMYGARAISLVAGDISTAESAGLTIDGIFIDETATTWSTYGSSYYLPLYQWIKSNYPSDLVTINPGTIPDSSNWMTACDIIMDFEDTYSNYSGVFSPSWVFNYPSTRFWHSVYSTPSSAADVDACFSTAAANNAAYLFVTNISGSGNTYGSLPGSTDWNEEVRDASSGSGGGGTVPAAPTGLTATAGVGQVALDWTGSSGATSYDVYRGTSSGGESGTPVSTGLTGTSYADTGVTGGTKYYYKVSAVDSVGTSGQSNEASATPTGATTITNETLTVSGSKVTIKFSYTGSWTYYHVFIDSDRNATTGYTISGIGANYLLENGELYSAGANGSTWDWNSVAAETYSNSGGVASWTFPLSAIGSPSAINVVYQAATSSTSYTTGEFSYTGL